MMKWFGQRRKKVLPWFVAGALLYGCSTERKSGPLSPEEALESFQLHKDFQIELYAAEPHVLDPVEIVFDEYGRVYTAEMLDYPDDPPPGQPPRSQIHLLEDTDGDGQIDHSTIFADRLLQVTSLLPWKGGLIVASAPDILYLKDTNGDKKADVRRVLFTGFKLANSESRITNLRFNIDNWIYASNNGQAGEIQFVPRPDAPPVSVLGADFRFRLDQELFEPSSGPTQFGQGINDWGHRFITQNTVHVRHVVLPRQYLDRNPFLNAGETAEDISDHGKPSAPVFQISEPQSWRLTRSQMRQQRYRENQLESVRPLNPSTEIARGFFTGAAGGTIYSGDTFPEEFRGNLFTGDVAGNLVHRDILRPSGVTYTASRAPEEKEREFLASTDQWFRPCNFATGPDGNLYLVDIYREFIETPESVPEELKKKMDFYSGNTRGRIYRIVPKNGERNPVVDPKQFPARKKTRELVDLLSHPNGWWRFTAHRLLLERQDQSVIPALKRLIGDPKSASQTRLHALYVLEALSGLDASLVAAALKDPNPSQREHGLQLAEAFLSADGRASEGLATTITTLTKDPSLRVALQATLTAGSLAAPQATESLAAVAAKHSGDQWFRKAILSSAAGSSVHMLHALLRQTDFFTNPSKGKEQFVQELATVIGARAEANEIRALVSLIGKDAPDASWQLAALAGLGRGLNVSDIFHLKPAGAAKALTELLNHSSDKVRNAGRAVARHFEIPELLSASIQHALDEDLPWQERKSAIELLASGRFETVQPVFQKLLSSLLHMELGKATLQSLASFDHPGVANLVISRWRNFSPSMRSDALDVLLGHRRRVPQLLAAVEGGRIEQAALDLPKKEKLLRNPDPSISARARRLFQDETSDRVAVVASYQPTLDQEGNAKLGRGIFEKNCGNCHRPRRGSRVGPDLSGVSSQTKAQLLQSILNPSRVIDGRYTNYIVTTKNGRIIDGLILSETPGTLTLRREGGDKTILRSQVAEIRASPVSLMPDGLEESISQRDMADLIAFLQGRDLR